MTIFHLLFYSCVTLNGLDGLLAQKTCDWSHGYGALYATEEACKVAGDKDVGHPIFGDVYEDRKIEGWRCAPQHVETCDGITCKN